MFACIFLSDRCHICDSILLQCMPTGPRFHDVDHFSAIHVERFRSSCGARAINAQPKLATSLPFRRSTCHAVAPSGGFEFEATDSYACWGFKYALRLRANTAPIRSGPVDSGCSRSLGEQHVRPSLSFIPTWTVWLCLLFEVP